MKAQNSKHIECLKKEMQLRNYSPSTIDTYCKILAKAETTLQVSLESITTSQFKDYLHLRITKELISISLVNQSISAFKILQVDILKRNWQQIQIKRPRREKKFPVVLSIEEVERIIITTKNIKHKSLLMLAYSTGMRRQEVQTIRPSAIDSARMRVHVIQGKGKKDRQTILSTKALEMLRLYYKQEKPSIFLFESQGKKGQKLSDTTLNSIIKNSAKKAGIKKQISFHTLRHCFATHLLEKGVNLRLIQEFMGHTSIKTTSIYLHLANINISNVVSPLDTMNI